MRSDARASEDLPTPELAIRDAAAWELTTRARSSPVAVARDVDVLLRGASPTERITHLADTLESLAAVDPSTSEACELVVTALQPVIDLDEDEVLPALFWLELSESLSSPSVYLTAQRVLRNGPALLLQTRWQLAGLFRPAVLEAAVSELSRRRTRDPGLDERLSPATAELSQAYPAQKGPLVLAGLIIAVAAGSTLLADQINPTHLPENP